VKKRYFPVIDSQFVVVVVVVAVVVCMYVCMYVKIIKYVKIITTTTNWLSITGKHRKRYIIPEWLRYSSNQIRCSIPK